MLVSAYPTFGGLRMPISQNKQPVSPRKDYIQRHWTMAHAITYNI